jgi:hypothetical protein
MGVEFFQPFPPCRKLMAGGRCSGSGPLRWPARCSGSASVGGLPPPPRDRRQSPLVLPSRLSVPPRSAPVPLGLPASRPTAASPASPASRPAPVAIVCWRQIPPPSPLCGFLCRRPRWEHGHLLYYLERDRERAREKIEVGGKNIERGRCVGMQKSYADAPTCPPMH